MLIKHQWTVDKKRKGGRLFQINGTISWVCPPFNQEDWDVLSEKLKSYSFNKTSEFLEHILKHISAKLVNFRDPNFVITVSADALADFWKLFGWKYPLKSQQISSILIVLVYNWHQTVI